MATTTNYGWTTPDDTALVKDGASAIRTLGSSVDTTTKNLNPETTLGDIAYRSSTSNVNTRLGIGSTGNVLTVTGGVPVWAAPAAGGMTLLSTTNLSGTTTTISSISQDYVNLVAVVQNPFVNTATPILLKPDGVNESINMRISGSTVATSTDSIDGVNNLPTATNAPYTHYFLQINNYTDATFGKTFAFYGCNASSLGPVARFGVIWTTSAIDSFAVTTVNGTSTFSGGRVLIYGVK